MLPLFSIRKMASMPALKAVSVILTSIAMFSMVFLSLACHNSSNAFSGIFLIQTSTMSHTVRAGYFRLCETNGAFNSTVASSNSTMTCSPLSSFNNSSSGLAYEFAKHVVRPYFVVICAVLSAVTFVMSIGNIVIPRNQKVNKATLFITVLTSCFSTVAACWQEVAVHAATVLAPIDVKRGHRAASMVWSAVAMLILSSVAHLVTAQAQQVDEDLTTTSAYPSSTDTSFISNPFVVEKPK